jgi:hypothetical protein
VSLPLSDGGEGEASCEEFRLEFRDLHIGNSIKNMEPGGVGGAAPEGIWRYGELCGCFENPIGLLDTPPAPLNP